jgi:hypothetical protein
LFQEKQKAQEAIDQCTKLLDRLEVHEKRCKKWAEDKERATKV